MAHRTFKTWLCSFEVYLDMTSLVYMRLCAVLGTMSAYDEQPMMCSRMQNASATHVMFMFLLHALARNSLSEEVVNADVQACDDDLTRRSMAPGIGGRWQQIGC